MKFNNRSMALLGIPDLPTDAFKHVGDYKIAPQGGGGSGGGGGGAPAPTQTTVQNTNIPEYARPYVETMLGTAQQQLFNYSQDPNTGVMTPSGIKPYVPYSENPSDYVAGFSPLQNQAMTAAGQMGTSPELDTASGISGLAASKAMGANYDPTQFNAQQVNAPSLNQYQMGPAQQVGTQDYTGQNVGQYMNPYMQNVVDIQQREAQRQGDIASTQRGAQAARSGAFGGSRAAIMDAEAARNLATQKGDIQAQGQNAAFQNAQQQFNAQQNARIQTDLANQGMNYNTAAQNLNARLGVQQLGAGQNMQAQLANQQQNMTAQQLGEQSRQYGAGLGMQGLQTGLQAAGQLGQLGQTRYGQQVGNIGLQNQMGGQQQNQQQNITNQAIQNYATAQQYPQQQLAYMSGLLRGLPLQTATTQQYQAAPSMMSQAAGLGMAGYGLSRMKEGGKVKAKQRPAGLAELALSKMA
jgi:hypothetical protein